MINVRCLKKMHVNKFGIFINESFGIMKSKCFVNIRVAAIWKAWISFGRCLSIFDNKKKARLNQGILI